MTKELIRFGCASVGLVMLSACGATHTLEIDSSDEWHCGNSVQTGGYWFSYTDHVQWMIDNTQWNPATHAPSEGAAIDPLTSLSVSMPMAQDPAAPERACVIQVTGSTPAQPASE